MTKEDKAGVFYKSSSRMEKNIFPEAPSYY